MLWTGPQKALLCLENRQNEWMGGSVYVNEWIDGVVGGWLMDAWKGGVLVRGCYLL